MTDTMTDTMTELPESQEPPPTQVLTEKEKSIENLIHHLHYMSCSMNYRGSTIAVNTCYMSGREYEDYDCIRERQINGTMMTYPYNAIPTHPDNYWMIEALQTLCIVHSCVVPNWDREEKDEDEGVLITHNLPPIIKHRRSSGEMIKSLTTNLNHGLRISKRDNVSIHVRVHWLIDDTEITDESVEELWNKDSSILYKDIPLEKLVEHNKEIMPETITLKFKDMKCANTPEQCAVSKFVNSKLHEWCETTLQKSIDYYAAEKNITLCYEIC